MTRNQIKGFLKTETQDGISCKTNVIIGRYTNVKIKQNSVLSKKFNIINHECIDHNVHDDVILDGQLLKEGECVNFNNDKEMFF
jgi:hypothetical protein